MLKIPLLRYGTPYTSLDTQALIDVRTGEPLGTVSLANSGLIRRDAQRSLAAAHEAFRQLSTAEILEIFQRAAPLFLNEELPVGDAFIGPEEHLKLSSRLTGMPVSLLSSAMEKLADLLSNMPSTIHGLTRGLPPEVLDAGTAQHAGLWQRWTRRADALAAVLPSNSPGVHTVWLPALAFKTPVAVKPGRTEPLFPLRLLEALFAAGLPREVASYLPTDHAGGGTLVDSYPLAQVFGGAETVRTYADRPHVELHGPGYSKVVLGPDEAPHWERWLEVIAQSVANNGGRSCINASTVLTTGPSRPLAQALADHLAKIPLRPLDDPGARLAALGSKSAAKNLENHLHSLLERPGATLMTPGPLVAEVGGLYVLRPAVVWCEDPEHPLAKTEFGFPFASVVTVPEAHIPEWIGPTLALTALTRDPELTAALARHSAVERLHFGPIPTTALHWDQPHEGNLFDRLFERKAFTAASGWTP